VVRAAHALLVERVPGLVHRPEQQAEGHALDPARGDPDVVGADAGGERVHRLVLAAA
jgi:hypothetical protein